MTSRRSTVTRLAGLAASALLACGVALPASATTADAAGRRVPLRVMSYNIHHGTGTDSAFDLARTATAIRASGADVVGLQEVDAHWGARSRWRDETRELAGMLGMSGYFARIYDLAPPAVGAPDRRYGVSVLSRYPIVHAENHRITRLSSQDPNPTPRPMPGFPEVVVNDRGALVHVYDTHLDFRSEPSVRAAQVCDMLAIMAEDTGSRRVLVGDFNAPPGASELAPLWGYVDDALTLVGKRHDPTFPAASPSKRIDYVTVSPNVTVDAARVPRAPLYRVASDHRPVIADLTVTRGR